MGLLVACLNGAGLWFGVFSAEAMSPLRGIVDTLDPGEGNWNLWTGEPLSPSVVNAEREKHNPSVTLQAFLDIIRGNGTLLLLLYSFINRNTVCIMYAK